MSRGACFASRRGDGIVNDRRAGDACLFETRHTESRALVSRVLHISLNMAYIPKFQDGARTGLRRLCVHLSMACIVKQCGIVTAPPSMVVALAPTAVPRDPWLEQVRAPTQTSGASEWK